jgi:hypothetical protein
MQMVDGGESGLTERREGPSTAVASIAIHEDWLIAIDGDESGSVERRSDEGRIDRTGKVTGEKVATGPNVNG